MTEKTFDPKTIKAIATDLDGTLLRPDKTLSERNIRALQSCMEKGIRVILATGRAVDSGEKYRERIGTKGPHVYYNGAKVVDLSAGKIIQTRFVESEPVVFCIKLAREMGIHFHAFFPAETGDILVTENITPELEAYRKSTEIEVIIGNMEKQLEKIPKVVKAMFITQEENNKKIRSILQEQLGDSITVVQSSPVFLEIIGKGVSKGAGLVCALEYLDIKPENTIVFGDEENDLSMFSIAGFSAAPANAKEEVRKAALFQIPADAEDGVAVFLEENFGV